MVRKGESWRNTCSRVHQGYLVWIRKGEILGESVGEHRRIKEGKKVSILDARIMYLRRTDKKERHSDKM